jgi:hypothetical protein
VGGRAKPGHDEFNLIEKRTWPQRNCETNRTRARGSATDANSNRAG